MADTTSRTLRLLSLLQRRRYWPGPELAARLEVSDRTLRRDVERLRELGYTVESDRGVDGGYRLGGTTGDAVLLLDDDEAIALAAALHSAACGGSEMAEAALGALTKVLSMLGPSQRQRADAVRSATALGPASGAPAPRLSVIEVVAAACRDRVRLSFDYRVADGTPSSRYVEPCGLVALGSRWYLVAFDNDRDDWRTFRVDRMSGPAATRNQVPVRRPPSDDLSEFVRSSTGRASTPVVIDIAVPGAHVRGLFGTWVEVEDLAAERCRLRMDADSFRWPTHVVTTIDAPFTVVSPPELRDHLAATAKRVAAATRRPPR